MTIVLRRAAVLAALAFAATASQASTPTPEGGTTLTYLPDPYGTAGGPQWLETVKDEVCTGLGLFNHKEIGRHGFLFGNTGKPRPLKPGERIYFRAVGTNQEPGMGVTTMTYCTNVASFVPEEGHAYTLVQRNALRSCDVKVKDLTLGAEPPTFVAHPVVKACG